MLTMCTPLQFFNTIARGSTAQRVRGRVAARGTSGANRTAEYVQTGNRIVCLHINSPIPPPLSATSPLTRLAADTRTILVKKLQGYTVYLQCCVFACPRSVWLVLTNHTSFNWLLYRAFVVSEDFLSNNTSGTDTCQAHLAKSGKPSSSAIWTLRV